MCIGRWPSAIGPEARDGHAGAVTNRPLLPAFVVLWSSGYVVGAVAIGVADPLPLLAARFLLASLLAVPLALRHGRSRGAPLGRIAVAGVLLQVVQFSGVYGGFALGVPAALSALVMLGLAPLVTSAIAVSTGHERGDARLWTGLAIGVAGVAISLAPELGDARVGVGVGVTLLGMLGLAGGTVVQKHWAGGADVRVSAAVQSVTGAILVTPAVAVFGGRFEVGPRLLLSLAWLAWGMGIVTLLLLVHLLRAYAASTVGALLLVVPAVTAIASAPVLGEALHAASLVGMAVALVGVAAVIRRDAPGESGRRETAAEPGVTEPAAAPVAARGGRHPECAQAPLPSAGPARTPA
jgi:drug/metabolite transporter (DMT)-like permease